MQYCNGIMYIFAWMFRACKFMHFLFVARIRHKTRRLNLLDEKSKDLRLMICLSVNDVLFKFPIFIIGHDQKDFTFVFVFFSCYYWFQLILMNAWTVSILLLQQDLLWLAIFIIQWGNSRQSYCLFLFFFTRKSFHFRRNYDFTQTPK